MSTVSDDLHYRTVAPDDEQFVLNTALAYNLPLDEARRALWSAAPDTCHGLYRNGRLVTQCMLYLPHVAHSGSGTIPSGNIDVVATPPEEQRRGYAACLLRAVCDKLRSQGMLLCILSVLRRSLC
ncbi:MAG: GNAT family N-acetyltransferase [Roseiflexaceae bacterium]|nr:GNAT family N-acetyltransferase [Roseiflexus sp.]MDW8214150.1 GNAT family N-acetyltransferase [Roseiflexaceae bacterium]